MENLQRELHRILQFNAETSLAPEHTATRFFDRVSDLHGMIEKDVDAMYQGDPAARSRREVVRTYPGFVAIAAYRIAHELYVLGVREIPRVITEYAHSRTV